MSLVPRVLLLVSDKDDKRRLEQNLTPYAELSWASHPEHVSGALHGDTFDVAFCAGRELIRSWREILKSVRDLNPDLPVIILSETAGEREWVDMLDAGAFDLLVSPYSETLLPAMEHAIASREARRFHVA